MVPLPTLSPIFQRGQGVQGPRTADRKRQQLAALLGDMEASAQNSIEATTGKRSVEYWSPPCVLMPRWWVELKKTSLLFWRGLSPGGTGSCRAQLLCACASAPASYAPPTICPQESQGGLQHLAMLASAGPNDALGMQRPAATTCVLMHSALTHGCAHELMRS